MFIELHVKETKQRIIINTDTIRIVYEDDGTTVIQHNDAYVHVAEAYHEIKAVLFSSNRR